MDRIERYKEYVIRAFEQRPGNWLAEIRKQDGSMIIRDDSQPRPFVVTPHARNSADAAIAFAKRAIDGPSMH